MIAEKDTKKIGTMYAEGFKALADMDMDWLRELDTPEKLVRGLPMLYTMSNIQSVFYQTNRVTEAPRDIDLDVIEDVRKEADRLGVDIFSVTDALSIADQIRQSVRQNTESASPSSIASGLIFLAKMNSTIPAGTKLGQMSGTPDDPAFQRFLTRMTVVMLDSEDPMYASAMKAAAEGPDPELNAVMTLEGCTSAMLEITAGTKGSIGEPGEWKTYMDQISAAGYVMDTISLSKCLWMAKNGGYDEMTSPGEGEKMLRAIRGDFEAYEQLSDFSKAAVASKMVADHPKLFAGSAEEMYNEARRLRIDLDNPVYVSAMNRVMRTACESYEKDTQSGYSGPQS